MIADHTFGFELEWAAGVEPLLSVLCDLGLLADTHLHGYHCDCRRCSYHPDHGMVLRAQRDSSCNGEIITLPFQNIDQARPVMAAIEEAAVHVDAEPGLEAGFHVHTRPIALTFWDYDPTVVSRMLWMFLIFEQPLLDLLAGASFVNMVSAANSHLTHMLAQLTNYGVHTQIIDRYARGPNDAVRVYRRADQPHAIRAFFQDLDRHATLNTNTQYQTWEYRLWRSTRVAWRMEMYCQLTRAFATPDVTFDLAAVIDGPDFADLDNLDLASEDYINILIEVIENHDSDLAALMRRQVTYITTGLHLPDDDDVDTEVTTADEPAHTPEWHDFGLTEGRLPAQSYTARTNTGTVTYSITDTTANVNPNF